MEKPSRHPSNSIKAWKWAYFFLWLGSERTCSWRNVNVGSSKAIQKSDIPVNIVKGHRDTFAKVRFKCFGESLEKSKLPHCLKLVKKGAQILKNNYRPVSIMLILSELFDRLIKKQLSEIFWKILDLSLWKDLML